ncbi:polyhydroxyalkanoate depolymerase, intracellular [Fulvimarina manganoxydans]|uniref:Polyhydroxyalkanoate depolymerase, intracellular n=1 Tax=Fulvimarina manganoxydans TaxID=937218 RepID=A0A1W2BG78_9HYPH|nr:polyhydroxyalkanoate depolymerase, intracellular [Fulvimarina manganoxydans]
MLYYFYEWNHAALTPMRAAADATRLFYQNPMNPLSGTTVGRAIAAGAELFERTTRVYSKPEFGLTQTVVDHQPVEVKERVVVEKPFCRLLHFDRQLPQKHKADPRFLIVAPLSGHYATLLRGTVEALLPYADVYITDWTDARTVPVSEGKFDLDDYTQYVIDFLRHLGPDTHVLAVCQPAVPVLMAVAAMEKAGDDAAPATMTLMGGPIDTRVHPTAVNRLAQMKGIDWFRDNVIMSVPFPQPGFTRKVYPGFLQLTGFMSMNLDRHMIAHKDFFWHLVDNDGDSAEKHRTFYDEYNAVMDMTAEFYLQTVEEVFIKHSLPKGEMMFKGDRIDLSAVKRVALLTVEGENDDISGVGQTEAAQDLCVNIPEEMRVHYVQPKVGHYGVFNGSRFRAEIVPRIIDFALTHGRTHSSAHLPKGANKTQTQRNYGAHAERHSKAKELGQSLSAGGETGIADPLLGMGNPFAAGERMMRVFTEPAEKLMQEGVANVQKIAKGRAVFGSFGGGVMADSVVSLPENVAAPAPESAKPSASEELAAETAEVEVADTVADQVSDATQAGADAIGSGSESLTETVNEATATARTAGDEAPSTESVSTKAGSPEAAPETEPATSAMPEDAASVLSAPNADFGSVIEAAQMPSAAAPASETSQEFAEATSALQSAPADKTLEDAVAEAVSVEASKPAEAGKSEETEAKDSVAAPAAKPNTGSRNTKASRRKAPALAASASASAKRSPKPSASASGSAASTPKAASTTAAKAKGDTPAQAPTEASSPAKPASDRGVAKNGNRHSRRATAARKK